MSFYTHLQSWVSTPPTTLKLLQQVIPTASAGKGSYLCTKGQNQVPTRQTTRTPKPFWNGSHIKTQMQKAPLLRGQWLFLNLLGILLKNLWQLWTPHEKLCPCSLYVISNWGLLLSERSWKGRKSRKVALSKGAVGSSGECSTNFLTKNDAPFLATSSSSL